ncbi:hypothetical protein [Methylobacterium oryzihabitans]|uniref:Uncharacterized protein n=1 Tax=Methylobacterium oryzihabitans TaxID=2499852 RepID=A0A3S2W5I3_9HYPH|nr:hypothetical protein [Methylobacterium oryzihabitans]RVU14180.1 hypothetical protein EOE48_24235 [Methylobacterium oryzihabitans]
MFCPSNRPISIRRMPHLHRLAHPTSTLLSLGMLFAISAAPAQANPSFEGRYQGRGEGRLTLKVSPRGKAGSAPTYAVDAFTGIPNACSGTVSGVARQIDTNTLRLSLPGDEAACEITLRFGTDRKRVRMEEQGCSDFHGPACAFDGALTRR